MAARGAERLFDTVLILKGLTVLAELFCGLALWLLPSARAVELTARFTLHDPAARRGADPLAAWLAPLLGIPNFWAVYVLAGASVKLVLIWGIARFRAWAWRAAFPVFGLFAAWQLWCWSATGAPVLLAATGFDLVFLALLWRQML